MPQTIDALPATLEPAGKSSAQSGRDSRKAPKWDYRPSGRLKLAIESGEWLYVRRFWSDGKKQKVEDLVGHFLVPFVASLEPCLHRLSRGRMSELESKVDFLRRLADTVEQALGIDTTVVLSQGEALEIIANLREWANELDWPASSRP